MKAGEYLAVFLTQKKNRTFSLKRSWVYPAVTGSVLTSARTRSRLQTIITHPQWRVSRYCAARKPKSRCRLSGRR